VNDGSTWPPDDARSRTARGLPAAGMTLELVALDGATRRPVKKIATKPRWAL